MGKQKEVFGLRTDNMSQEVFQKLNKLAAQKKLSSYLIGLVEADIAREAQNQSYDEMIHKQDLMLDMLTQISSKIQNSSFYSKPFDVEHEKEDFREGLLIQSDEIKGQLDPDDMLDQDY